MKIAIVNDIHVGKPLMHRGKARASSHLIEERLDNFLQDLVSRHKPDLLVNLGDLIRGGEEDLDLKRYRNLIGSFKRLQLPILHLLGNHELKKMSENEVESIWQEHGFLQKSYGSINTAHVTLLWFGLKIDEEDERVCVLPTDQLNWLKDQLKQAQKPTIIFTHYPIDDHDVSGNLFYEAFDNRQKKALFLKNQDSIRDVIASSNSVIAVLQAHLHYFHTNLIGSVPYITCPAMGDNICGPHVEDNIPEIYTILTLNKNRLTAKAFSGEYCFAGAEFASQLS